MKQFYLIIAISILSGCASKTKAILEDPDHFFNSVQVEFIEHDTRHTFRPADGIGVVQANTQLVLGKPKCRIYARLPKNQNDKKAFEFLGHELLHCLRGRWHDYPRIVRVQNHLP